MQAAKASVAIALLMLLGLSLVVVSFFGENKPQENPSDSSVQTAYEDRLTGELEQIISSISGAGSAKVMITFDSSFENIYAYDAGVSEGSLSSSGRTSEKKLVLTGGHSSQTPVLIKKLSPRVKGVLVVCEGGGDITIAKKIREATGTLFGISESRVCVTDGMYANGK